MWPVASMLGRPKWTRIFPLTDVRCRLVSCFNPNDVLPRKNFMNLRLSPSSLALAGLSSVIFSAPTQAQNLVTLFEAAKGYDAAYKSAQSLYTANLAKAEQAMASVLPTVGLTGAANRTTVDLLTGVLAGQSKSYSSLSANLSAVQPLYRPANKAT